MTLNILAVYAPNNHNANAQFWSELCERWDDPQARLPKINILLGDFNIVEAAIDCLPPHPDPESPVNALWHLKTSLSLTDSWRTSHPPPETDFTFKQDRALNASMSRIDCIYLDDENLGPITLLGCPNRSSSQTTT